MGRLGAVLGDLGSVLGRSWSAWGRSWVALGHSWAALGPLLAPLGPLLAPLGVRKSLLKRNFSEGCDFHEIIAKPIKMAAHSKLDLVIIFETKLINYFPFNYIEARGDYIKENL